MLRSMTGQGLAAGTFAEIAIEVEVRSVNHRYLKVTTKLSKSVAAFEPQIDALVRQVLRRGAVSVAIYTNDPTATNQFSFDQPGLEKLWRDANEVAQRLSLPAPSFDALLAIPAILVETPATQEQEPYFASVSEILRRAMIELDKMRAAEGQAMRAELLRLLDLIEKRCEAISVRAPAVVAEFTERFSQKMEQAFRAVQLAAERAGKVENVTTAGLSGAFKGWDPSIDSSIILRESQMFADKSDIREELVRLESHLELFRRAMGDADSQGRKLDFLVQELNREINTIGSKANDAVVTEHVIESKTILEQIREIIQNIE